MVTYNLDRLYIDGVETTNISQTKRLFLDGVEQIAGDGQGETVVFDGDSVTFDGDANVIW